MSYSLSTLTDIEGTERSRRSRVRRRATVTLLLLVVLAGAVGLFGVRSGTVTGSGGGYDLRVVHARVARSGLDVPLRFSVHRAGGFDQDVTLAVSAGYFDIFETQGFHPQPSDETSTPRFLYLTFTAPPGEDLDIQFDGYIQPGSQIGRRATTAVVVDGRPVVQVRFSTFLVP